MQHWAEKLSTKYQRIRNLTEKICQPLAIEDYVSQPIVDVSPPKWHLGHTTWFFENFILCEHKDKYRHFNKDFNFIFNSYYESQGERILRHHRGSLTRPTVEEVLNYRNYIDQNMMELLETESTLPESLLSLIDLGLHHEQQHQELLITDIKYILGGNPLHPVYNKELVQKEYVSQDTIKVGYYEMEEGIYTIGHPDKDNFCYDNEKGRHKVFLHGYKIMNRLITNREYLEFIEAGGYENFEFWLGEGWDWVQKENIFAPLYWFKKFDEWSNYTLHGVKEIEPEAPVTHVSYYEAEAFARWKNKRLPTEFEWEAAYFQNNEALPKTLNLLEKENFSPIVRQENNDQMIGDVWEWTNSAYLPYPFYQQDKGALGEYNGKFMVNQMVLRGGSCATQEDHIRPTYRNFFHPDKRWQFTGIRLAESI